MLTHLDLSTVFLTTGFVSGALLLCMVVVARQRRTYPGFLEWTLATLSLSVGMALIGFRDRVPEFFTVIVANSAILASFVLIHDGLIAFAGKRARRTLYGIPFALLVLPYLYLTYIHPNVRARVMVSSTVFVGYSIVVLIFHFREIMPTYRRSWLLPVGFIVQGLIFAARIVRGAVEIGAPADFMRYGAPEALLIILAFSTSILIIVGLVVINYQRTELDLRAAINEVKTLRGIVPICASCKKIRDDEGYWSAVDTYLQLHTEAEFSHGLCPECTKKLYPGVTLRSSTTSE